MSNENQTLTKGDEKIMRRVKRLDTMRKKLALDKEDEQSLTYELKKIIQKHFLLRKKGVKIWGRRDEKNIFWLAKIVPQRKKIISQKDLIRLIGSSKAIELMETINYSIIEILVKTGKIKKRSGLIMNLEDLERITTAKNNTPRLYIDSLPPDNKIAEEIEKKERVK